MFIQIPFKITSILILVVLSAFVTSTGAAGPGSVPAAIQEVANIVLKKNDWLAEAKVCPDKLIASSQRQNYLELESCTLNPQQCLTQCGSDRGDMCYVLAYSMQKNGAPDQAYEALYQRSCKLGVISGCTNHAAGLTTEKPHDKTVLQCAARTYDRACELDDPWACTMSALHLTRGLGVSKNLPLALKKLSKSCKFGADDPACSYAKSLQKEIEPTLARSRK